VVPQLTQPSGSYEIGLHGVKTQDRQERLGQVRESAMAFFRGTRLTPTPKNEPKFLPRHQPRDISTLQQ